MSFGGSPRCTTCGKAVYHAEQVLGPARKVYHKICLKCENCGKRLDPGSLVEHESLPYCARCHTQLFGTRDLRHANVNPITPSPARTPSKPPRSPSPPRFTTPLSPRPVPPPQEYYHPPPLPDLSPQPISSSTPTSSSTYSFPTHSHSHSHSNSLSSINQQTDFTRPNFRDPRPISVPYAGRRESLDERGLIRRGDSPRSKVGERVGGDDTCNGCGKRVYAAEGVFAVGNKWHKGCLKCTSCGTTVDPARVSDKDGAPYCKNCYAKEHGPGGIVATGR